MYLDLFFILCQYFYQGWLIYASLSDPFDSFDLFIAEFGSLFFPFIYTAYLHLKQAPTPSTTETDTFLIDSPEKLKKFDQMNDPLHIPIDFRYLIAAFLHFMVSILFGMILFISVSVTVNNYWQSSKYEILLQSGSLSYENFRNRTMTVFGARKWLLGYLYSLSATYLQQSMIIQ